VLTKYLTRTRRLLQQPSAQPSPLYSDDVLTDFINEARGQLAGESESIRVLGTVPTVANTQSYAFTEINVGVPATTGIQAPLHVRSAMFQIGVGDNGNFGQKWMRPRNWEWFQLYKLNVRVPTVGQPEVWAQYAQGAGGSFYISPIPDDAYALMLDCVCYPIDLVNDTTVEAIPYLWTDAVPFGAAYFALMSAQGQQRSADADKMLERYKAFVDRARKVANPSVNRYLYEQAVDPTQINKLSLPQSGGGRGAA
jgi:hypothetical protein